MVSRTAKDSASSTVQGGGKRRGEGRGSASIFVIVGEGFTGGGVDEMLSAAREAIH